VWRTSEALFQALRFAADDAIVAKAATQWRFGVGHGRALRAATAALIRYVDEIPPSDQK
jgi:hypothetical protein